MKVVIIGGVAAGPKVASRIVRLIQDAEITIVEKGEFLSYAGCGLPYYISGVVKTQKELMTTPVGTVRDTAFFQKVKNVKILNHTEATEVDSKNRIVTIKKADGSIDSLSYDKLVFATGATPVSPPISGIGLNNIFSLKGIEDAEAIKAKLANQKALDAVIVGGGLIGVEVAEAFTQMGCRVSIVEALPQILSILDEDMIVPVQKHFESKGVKILTNTKVIEFKGLDKVEKVITDKGELPADIVIMAIGVKPNISLAQRAGIKLGKTGAIAVNKQMLTSDPNIYAAGDCAEKKHLITEHPCYVPLGSTANKEGRVAANSICDIDDSFNGILGSAICKVFDFTVARTGLSEKEARSAGYNVVTALAPAPDKPHFMPTAKLLLLKLIADRKTGRILGAQGTGGGDVDKRVNIIATGLTMGMKLDQLSNLDLCYAPPYSPAVDNIITAGNILRNKIDGLMEGISSKEVKELFDNNTDFTFLDCRSPKEVEQMSIDGSVNMPLGTVRSRLDTLDKNRPIVTFCKISLRGYEAALILKKAGFKSVKVMDGGVLMWPYKLNRG